MVAGQGSHLFPSKYVLVEVKLDLLVGDVDAELLERVFLEVLKAEDVQDADVQALVLLSGSEKSDKSGHLNMISFKNSAFDATLYSKIHRFQNLPVMKLTVQFVIHTTAETF